MARGLTLQDVSRLWQGLGRIEMWAESHVGDGRDPVNYERCLARIRDEVDQLKRLVPTEVRK